jgi:dihydrofolate reductase
VGKLVYIANVSADGHVEDENGSLAWSQPDDELFAFLTELVRPVGTYLYGRRMYETMAVWETDPALAATSQPLAAFADVWRAADKVVWSTTLEAPHTGRTRLVRDLDAAAVRGLKASSSRDLTVGGAQLAGQLITQQLVDECHLLVRPVLLGGGKPVLPAGVRAELELLGERRIGSGTVHLHYAVRPHAAP